MNKIICPKCGGEVSKEFGKTLSYCANCGEKIHLPPKEKVVSSSETAPAPKTKSQFPTILATSFITALFLILLFAGGTYWFINRSDGISSIAKPIKSPENANPKPTPRTKSRSSISASEITKVGFSESIHNSLTTPALLLFGNINTSNYSHRSGAVIFSADGTASRVINKTQTVSGTPMPEIIEKYNGSINAEQFAKLAQAVVENDFLNEEDSKTSTSLPINYTLTISYNSGEKIIKTSNTGKDTPEVDAILKAFKDLQNQIGWKKE